LTPEKASRRRLWRLHRKVSVEQGVTILSLEGRLGHDAAGELETVAGQLLAAAPTDLVIDLSGVDYLSSAALNVFKALSEGQSGRGGRLALRSPSAAARLALELSGLLALVDQAETTP
jgi:anti-anti-sigma factor